MNFFNKLIRPIYSCSAKYENKINLTDQLKGFYGRHRSGWFFVLKILKSLHNPNGILLDSFIERTFCWHPEGVRANMEPWIGFIHVPPKIPKWFQYEQSNEFIFNTELWKRSLPYCLGLFTLSNYHKRNLESKLDILINDLVFPTETPALKWTWERFEANKEKKIVQVGWWLRKLHTIFQLATKKYKKIFIRATYTELDSLIRQERDILLKEGQFNDKMYETTESINYISNKKYDKLLSENIVIINLYDSSANNTVIECIVRNTPILVNPIESVVEYLGEDYPFYFTSLEEAVQKAEDIDLVYQTHNYLKKHAIKEKLKREYFLKSFVESEIYSNL